MKKLLYFSFVLLTSFLLVSCHGSNKNKRSSLLPSVSGKAGDVLIVIDKAQWESEPGAEIRKALACEYPFLPQREPMFTLYNAPHSTFNGGFLVHRNIVVVNVGEKFDSSRVAYQEDVWAAPQTVITISAPDKESLTEIIVKEKDKIASSLEQAERNRIIHNAKTYEEPQIRTIVANNFGGSPFFPKGYTIKKQTPDFMWISYETTYVNQGLFIYRYPYTSDEDFTLNHIIEYRNEFLKNNVPGMRDQSYMTTSPLINPGMKWVQYKKRTFVEVRGLWELVNDYMGGPFVCHVFTDAQKEYVLVLEGFVYAPKFDKRNYLRHVESILYSFEWNK